MPGQDRRRELTRRLRELEAELARAQAEFVSVATGDRIPGLFLVVEVAGRQAGIPAAVVREIVRLVETRPLPDAPAHVLGSFLYRGEAVVAIDLGKLLGRAGEPDLESHVIVLQGDRAAALVVDRVRSLAEAPVVASGKESGGAQDSFFNSRLVSGLCKDGEQLIPLLDLDRVLEGIAP